MSYPLKSSNLENRRRGAIKRYLIIVIVLIICLFVLAATPVRGILFFVTNPIWKLENYFLNVNSNIIQGFRFKQTLITENRLLSEKVAKTNELISLNNILLTENDNLKDLLGRKNSSQKTILAAVLVKPPQIPYDQLLIDIGANDGVSLGDKVIADTNINLGEVIEVLAGTAKIALYSSPGRKLSVVLGTNSVSVEATGLGGGNFNIILPKEVEVKENDVIMIPSITPNIFGIVEKIEVEDRDSFQTILFKSPINISELNFVEVILK